jgi:hypothetical protein
VRSGAGPARPEASPITRTAAAKTRNAQAIRIDEALAVPVVAG